MKNKIPPNDCDEANFMLNSRARTKVINKYNHEGIHLKGINENNSSDAARFFWMVSMTAQFETSISLLFCLFVIAILYHCPIILSSATSWSGQSNKIPNSWSYSVRVRHLTSQTEKTNQSLLLLWKRSGNPTIFFKRITPSKTSILFTDAKQLSFFVSRQRKEHSKR